ncbi:cysteine-rich CWC family protein [Mitsuaria sp. GD03876]|uniref:cysteine-rich CWC family protein n=1 Tax=Mitsuaria sp. GD03876 TaxID=2975399 RepID=UPI00244BFC57|nr:cysteine-rich CWC family protein [Mitsuaria sp. GD03876]MDH0866850.1 cysteine-rich CWC family protein [Mitsuaria sp. GD03876]
MTAPATPVPLDNTACPRCGGGFHCGVEDGWCACFGTRLGEDLKRELAARWPDRCLCLRCLAELARDDPASHVPASPGRPPGATSTDA